MIFYNPYGQNPIVLILVGISPQYHANITRTSTRRGLTVGKVFVNCFYYYHQSYHLFHSTFQSHVLWRWKDLSSKVSFGKEVKWGDGKKKRGKLRECWNWRCLGRERESGEEKFMGKISVRLTPKIFLQKGGKIWGKGGNFCQITELPFLFLIFLQK